MMPSCMPQILVLSLIVTLLAGCSSNGSNADSGSGSQPGGSAARIEVRDGKAMCVFSHDKREFAVGKMDGDQVTLYASYGYVKVALKDLKDSVAKISAEEGQGTFEEQQRALYNAVVAQQLPAIWKAEKATVDGTAQTVSEDNPVYLILRADKTFRIVKSGRKREGTWTLDAKNQLVMTIGNDESKTAKIERQPGDKLELTMQEHGTLKLQYGRVNLTTEPDAADK